MLGVSIALGIISTVLSGFVIVSYVVHKGLRSRSFAMILQLAITDCLGNISYFFGQPADGSASCYAQAMLQQFSELANFTWVTLIALTLYMKVVRQAEDVEWWKICAFAYGFPAVFALAPLDFYGEAGGWCWIATSEEVEADAGTIWRFAGFYVWLWLFICVQIAAMWKVTLFVRSVAAAASSAGSTLGSNTQKILTSIERLKYFPGIMIVCWLPLTINRIYNVARPRQEVFALAMLSIVFRSLQGPANALAYAFTGTVRTTWWVWLRVHAPGVYRACALWGCVAGNEGLGSALAMQADGGSQEDGEELRRLSGAAGSQALASGEHDAMQSMDFTSV